ASGVTTAPTYKMCGYCACAHSAACKPLTPSTTPPQDRRKRRHHYSKRSPSNYSCADQSNTF
ncbi:hypothetical protein, partial [Lentimonas sp. CC21]|uniref:hypothetical protein n=1 Tax=Lentimonas sp. CC21 TaxID=2676098 RepID=UPI001A7E3EF9